MPDRVAEVAVDHRDAAAGTERRVGFCPGHTVLSIADDGLIAGPHQPHGKARALAERTVAHRQGERVLGVLTQAIDGRIVGHKVPYGLQRDAVERVQLRIGEPVFELAGAESERAVFQHGWR